MYVLHIDASIDAMLTMYLCSQNLGIYMWHNYLPDLHSFICLCQCGRIYLTYIHMNVYVLHLDSHRCAAIGVFFKGILMFFLHTSIAHRTIIYQICITCFVCNRLYLILIAHTFSFVIGFKHIDTWIYIPTINHEIFVHSNL